MKGNCRRRTKALRACTAAVAAVAVSTTLTATSDAFIAPSRQTATCTRPLHADLAATAPSPLLMSASSSLDRIYCHNDSLSINGAFRPVALTIVPSTSFLSSGRARPVVIPVSDSKYGGRASSGSPTLTDPMGVSGAAIVGGGNRATLGFAIWESSADFKGYAEGTSRLAISSTTDQFSSPSSGTGNILPDRRNGKVRSGGDGSLREIDTRTNCASGIDGNVMSPVKSRNTASLLEKSFGRAGTAAGLGIGLGNEGKQTKDGSAVPAWFPWVPTRSQIETLRASELREACDERGLEKLGLKAELQDRLMKWTTEQHLRRVRERRSSSSASANSVLLGNVATKKQQSPLDDMIDHALGTGNVELSLSSSSSIGEIEPLINRRKALRRSKDADQAQSLPVDGKKDEEDIDSSVNVSDEGATFAPTREYLSELVQAFNSPTAKCSNLEVNEMYMAAKLADQGGDRRLAKKILTELSEATPKDPRIVRRLSRLEMEEGNIFGARSLLQTGIRRNPGDSSLLHGLATLEAKHGDTYSARALYKEAIRTDPTRPNSYHALGTLEHSRGNIRLATTVLRHGLKMCPTNHRLHHALGSLYQGAHMLDMAELSYRKALECSPDWSKSFAFTALSYIEYQRGNLRVCRRLLKEGLGINSGSHSQGWLALAQLEESEGDIDASREVYIAALEMYESTLRKKKERSQRRNPSRSGDKWIFVYMSWTRMEEAYGTFQSANAVYARATKVHRNNSLLFLGWAQLNANRGGHDDRARSLFRTACDKTGNRNADPHRAFAEFEMSRGNYSQARAILYLGAKQLSGATHFKTNDMSRLYHAWAICEWHLGSLDRTETLFDQAMRLTDAGNQGMGQRSLILQSLSRFYFDTKDFVMAQHCICLSLKENGELQRYPQLFSLWAAIAEAQGNDDLSSSCNKHVKRYEHLARVGDVEGDESSSAPTMTGPIAQTMLRKAPWQHKLVDHKRCEENVIYPRSSLKLDGSMNRMISS